MKYDKPKLTVTDLALLAVQGSGKGINPASDSAYLTVNAYEADE